MCTQSELTRLLAETKRALSDVFGERLEQVLLYGSYARGDQTAESDIDVMAVVDMPKDELVGYRRQISDLSSMLDLRYGVVLSIKLQSGDALRQYGAVLPFFQNVMREGKRVV